MSIRLDFYFVVTSIGIFLALFLALVIFGIKKGNRKANVIFSIFLVLVSITIFNLGILIDGNLYLYFPHLLKISTPFLLLLGPFFLFYVKALITRDFKFHKRTLLHFLPFFIIIGIYFPFYIQSSSFKINYIQNWLNGKTEPYILIEEYILFFIIIIHLLSYIFYTNIMLINYEKSLKQVYSSIEKINLKWIRYFIYAFFIAVIGLILIFLLIVFFFKFVQVYKFIPIIISCSICFLAYRVLIQPEILAGIALITSNNKQKNNNKNNLTILKDKDASINKLMEIMQRAKVYKDPQLTLPKLSKKLNINRNTLSFIINTYFKVNFYDFVNRYRIEEVKKYLRNSESKKVNLLHAALDAGFNSKTSFNVIFKKYTKMTPTQYKNQYSKI
ncbi:MAG: helix-turn-helix domain-containing protein [Spirochaetia bacterium]